MSEKQHCYMNSVKTLKAGEGWSLKLKHANLICLIKYLLSAH